MNSKTRLTRRKTLNLTISITLILVVATGGLAPMLVQGASAAAYRLSSPPRPEDAIAASYLIQRTLSSPLQGGPGVGDASMFMVTNDGSLTSLLFSLGGDLGLNPTASHYQYVFMAALIIRWGEYESVLDNMFEFLGANATTGTEGFDLTTFLSLLPSGVLIIVFTGGTPSETQAWGAAIAQEFQEAIGVPFIRLIGIPPLPFEGATLAVEAYTCMLSEEGGRDAFQGYMSGLESTRQGMAGLVTPTLASDSIGGIGLLGLVNASFGDGGGFSVAKASKQAGPELMPAAAWFSAHRDKFFGTDINTFDLNDFTGHSGSISMGSLDFMEFVAAFPSGVTVTSYDPADMEVNITAEGVAVSRSTDTWQSSPTVSNIVIDFQGSFPPALIVNKTITPARVSPGGTVQVTITLRNDEATETVYNIHVDDSHSWDLYRDISFPVTIIGDTSATYTSLGPGETVTLTYQVRLSVEGSYVSEPANVTFEDSGGTQYQKTTNKAYATAAYANVVEFLIVLLGDTPLSLPLIILFGLMALYFIIWLIKGILGLRRKPAPPPTAPPTQPPASPPTERPAKAAPPPQPPAKPSGNYCFNCGSPIPEGVEFCPACGAKIHK